MALLRGLRNRADSEHEQVLVRIAFSLVIFVYMVLAASAGSAPSPRAGQVIVLIGVLYIFGAFMLLAHLLRSPTVQPWRRFAGILLDLVCLPLVMVVGDKMTALLYPLYIWVVLGMGFRYGVRYLVMAGVLSVMGFSVVIAVTPYWRAQPALSTALLLALILIPSYTARISLLLDKSTKHAQKTKQKGTGVGHPPKAAEEILFYLLPRKYRDDVIGDLEEVYRTKMLPKYGPRKANLWYWWQTLRESFLALAPHLGPVLVGGSLLAAVMKVGYWLRDKFGF